MFLVASRDTEFPTLTRPFFFFFNDTATTEIYTLSLHDALPIYGGPHQRLRDGRYQVHDWLRSEEHTSELQSPCNLVCRLLLEKKKETATRGGDACGESAPGEVSSLLGLVTGAVTLFFFL